MIRPCSFSFVLPLAIGGCASVPSPRNAAYAAPYEERPPSLRSPAAPLDDVVEGAASTPNARAGVLDRGKFVRAVLRNNRTIDSARQAWRAALARVRQTGAFENPSVDVAFAPLSIGSSRAPLGYEVGISQKLPWFGKRALEESAAAAEAEASRNDFEAVRRELALTAVGLFDQYFVTVRAMDIDAEHVELMKAMYGGATAQFEAGRGSAQDSLEAESELARMERDAGLLAAERDVLVAQMNELLHREPGESLPPPPAELSLPPAGAARDPTGLQIAATRPEVVAARNRARAEGARAERAERDAYPDVTFSTSYNSMWDMVEHRWMVGVGVVLPIESGVRAGAADEADAMRAGFESDASRLEAAARTEIYVSLKRLSESRDVLGVLERRLLPLARARIDAARAGFAASRSPFATVIEAERNLRTTELEYQTARAECDRRHAELERALGLVPGVASEESRR